MLRTISALATLATLAGCSAAGPPDPATARLDPGTRCLAIELPAAGDYPPSDTLPGGTAVQVDRDTGRWEGDPEVVASLARIRRAGLQGAGYDPGADPDGMRTVRVLVLDGPREGELAGVVRCTLRPVAD